MLLLIWAIMIIIIVKNLDIFKEKYNTLKNIYVPKRVYLPSFIYNNRNYIFETVKLTNDFEPQNKEDLKNIYYSVLNNGWTNFTFYCPDEYIDCYDDVLEIASDDEYISLINNYVSTYNQYRKYNTSASTNGEIKLQIEKLYPDEEILALKIKINNIIQTLGIDKNNVGYDELSAIQTYILDMLVYDENYTENDKYSPSSTAFGALNTGKAICSGYSDLFSLFLDELNIPNFKVTSENHIWNVVYFRGKWKHIDVTWDDDENNKLNRENFFLIDTNALMTKDTKEHNFNQELYKELLNQ